MTKEVHMPSEAAADRPTELRLFRLNHSDRGRLAALQTSGQRFSRDLSLNNAHFTGMKENIETRLGRLNGLIEESSALLWQYASFRTASAAYLLIHDQLSARGVPPDEIFKFFSKCFAVSCEPYSRYTTRDISKFDQRNRNFLSAYKAGHPDI